LANWLARRVTNEAPRSQTKLQYKISLEGGYFDLQNVWDSILFWSLPNSYLSVLIVPVGADIAQAQDDIRVADVLTILYPLWWLSMPAMMKGYIDRVFARGFAYESHNGVVRGLLDGKKAVLITISGAPDRDQGRLA
jgi:putative NADPH-quinone reductase